MERPTVYSVIQLAERHLGLKIRNVFLRIRLLRECGKHGEFISSWHDFAPDVSRKGARIANSVLIRCLACSATLIERACTYRCKATIASVEGAGAASSRSMAS
ncbi:hypothetical protein LIER_19334 [Lithospermum erythrorhizon]|uniref:Uncharacterized protein n=1 Tax=Lithospermum erythrorhizon TaxID=34254 RepID=A0AAV3QK10_LITER